MGDFWEFASHLQQQISATARRSDVLKPLGWLLAIVGALLLGTIFGRGPDWLLSLLAMTELAAIALYAIIYVVCFFVDRDALRSESFSLNKMAIEKKLIGDSTTGMFAANKIVEHSVPEQSPKRLAPPKPRVRGNKS